ncbi:MAG: hypothetical protein JOY79_02905 [Acidobacteriaceae bacterium]|nr:hypothetical protein [Acidobacteriaceae bacterium]
MTTEMASETREEQGRAANQIYVTAAGLPLSIELNWPFHRSISGADFYVLHGDVRLETSGGLHALVAVQLTLTVREVLPSLEPADAEAPVINALRKETDRKQLEFLKSPKRLPVSFNSRVYDFRRNAWAFLRASDDEIAALLRRKVYWQTKLGRKEVIVTDPIDAQYLGATAEHLLQVANGLSEEISVKGETATALPALMNEGERIEAEMRAALADLEKKHSFERG